MGKASQGIAGHCSLSDKYFQGSIWLFVFNVMHGKDIRVKPLAHHDSCKNYQRMSTL